MDLRQLRCFLAVAEELHFGRAAARLHIAGPAVSQTIRSLESQLGLTLFERNNRRVELTDAGQLLVGEARAVLDRFDAALAAMARLSSGESGHVRVGAVPALPPRVVPELLARCAAEAPAIEVVVTALPSGRGPREALDGDSEVVLVRGELTEPGIATAIVAREPVGVALPVGHPLSARPAISPAELKDVPLISFSRASDPVQHDRLFSVLAAAGLAEPRIVHEVHPGAVEASLRLVASGAGLSLKLKTEVDSFGSKEVVWRPLGAVELEVVISAAWRSDRTTPAVERVLPLLTP